MRNSAINHGKIIKLCQLTFCLNSDQSVSGSGEFWQGAVRPPEKSVFSFFFISHPKHMLWVLKRTVSMRWFEHPKHMLKLMGMKIITILGS